MNIPFVPRSSPSGGADSAENSFPQKSFSTPSPQPGILRFIPFGGCGEIGMNCTALEMNGQILMIDCGQMFPDEEMLGVDYVIPDLNYIIERQEQLQAIVLTHAHEDHVGALPYMLKHFPGVPVYGTELTIAILREKMREHRLDRTTNWQVCEPRRPFEAGIFTVEPIAVTHSIIDAAALAIQSPAGVVIFSGDYKMDPTPPDGMLFDHYAFARYGEHGVLLLAADSTNVERPGSSPSEKSLIPELDRIISTSPRQVIVATFSSSLHRVQSILDLAAKNGRTVFITGLNMERNIRVAAELGAIQIRCSFESDIRSINQTPPEKRLILTTGSQGEPLSALQRMALEDHRQVRIEPGDTVILSSRMIPGNERSIYRMINHFARRGAVVHHEHSSKVHVSGHGYSDDIRHLLNLVNPRYLAPVHGEYRHLVTHRNLACAMGYAPGDVFVLENGDSLEFEEGRARRGPKIPTSRILVDGKGIGDVGEVVLRDRLHLSQDGMVVVVLAIDRQTSEIIAGPDILTRGFIYEEAEDAETGMIARAKEIVIDAYADCQKESREELEVVKTAIRRSLRKFFKQETERYPIILPIVQEV